MKPIKRAFKVWVRKESHSGFFSDFSIYTGKSQEEEDEGETYGLGERVVLQLSRQIEGKYHQVFCDNFFNTARLMECLLERKIHACGTARTSRRDFPEELKHLRLSRGDIVFRQKGSEVATIWKDKRKVAILSTMTPAQAVTTVEHRQPDRITKDIPCPQAIATYNAHMGGVDKGDQLRNYYKVRLKCMKYYKYIFWFLFDVSITNAYIFSSFVPSTTSASSHTLKQFRLTLASQLIDTYCSRKRAGRPRKSPSTPHPPPPLPPFDNDGPPPTQSTRPTLHLPSHSRSKRCVYCRQYRSHPHRKESVWCCNACPGQSTLCLTGRDDGSDCYRIWHTSLL